jgi:hypothetical protein
MRGSCEIAFELAVQSRDSKLQFDLGSMIFFCRHGIFGATRKESSEFCKVGLGCVNLSSRFTGVCAGFLTRKLCSSLGLDQLEHSSGHGSDVAPAFDGPV